MVFYSRLFEYIEFCLNRPCPALAILTFRELLHLFMTNKGIYIQIVNRHITNGKPRTARYIQSRLRASKSQDSHLASESTRTPTNPDRLYRSADSVDADADNAISAGK